MKNTKMHLSFVLFFNMIWHVHS